MEEQSRVLSLFKLLVVVHCGFFGGVIFYFKKLR